LVPVSEGWDYEDKDSFRVENLFLADSGFLARCAALARLGAPILRFVTVATAMAVAQTATA
jgi:hypothetical protein